MVGKVLGLHTPGRLSSRVAYSSFDAFMGKSKEVRFDSEVSIINLIASYHEAVHLFQDFYMGSTCLFVDNRDEYKKAVFNLFDHLSSMHEIKVPLISGQAYDLDDKGEKLLHNAVFMYKSFYQNQHLFDDNTEISRMTVKSFKDDIPNLIRNGNESYALKYSSIINDMEQLTGRSLYECHAALQTYMFMQRFIAQNPKSINVNLAKEILAKYFNPFEMDPVYSLPLRIFKKVDDLYLHTEVFDSVSNNPKYFERPIFSALLSYLLDFSLHAPPLKYIATSKGEDIHIVGNYAPTNRFINATFKLALWLGKKSRSTDKPDQIVNIPIEELYKVDLFEHDMGFNDITREWINYYNEKRKDGDSSHILNHRIKAMKRLSESPYMWQKFDIRDEFALIGIPIIYKAGGNVTTVMNCIVEDMEWGDLSESEKNPFLREKITQKVQSAVDYQLSLVEEDRRLALEHAIAHNIFIDGNMICPENVLKGSRLIPRCESKTTACSDHMDIHSIPNSNNCLAREILKKHNWRLINTNNDTKNIQKRVLENYEVNGFKRSKKSWTSKIKDKFSRFK
ncbi:hypothetical protein [Methanosarcina sp.]|uniref:hypothetical protein n=1 Tax=Methanosarcina sp. TaxID=2213 RepID=UPI002989537B|nr:hypothetical protein [Methanosarcina sp.]MDW5552153.1 hypothetical protein [Methanosarcina sp.]MDW5555884.1 hypothetical protein [Methanosarcina sp.]MDW5560111.1 hypothetical protein [Methanosarcina sp.]